ncbi:MAG: peptidoglycan-binding protein [Heteroscytonema crispum UTEX LB 1556]
MEYLAYSVMAQANDEPIADININLPKFKFNLKKLHNLALVALAGTGVLLGTLNQAQAATSRTQYYVRTNGACLKVRSAPSLNSRVVGCVSNGSALAPVVRYRNGFAQLSTGNYVSANWIGTRPGRGVTPGLGVGGRVVLGFGSEGAPVSQVQRALGIPVTGYYGEITDRAVRRFQANNGLSVDGRVGAETRLALGL